MASCIMEQRLVADGEAGADAEKNLRRGEGQQEEELQRGGHGDGGMGAEPGVQLHHGSGGAQRHSSFHVSSDSMSCPDVHTRLFLPSLHRLSVRMIKYASRALHSILRAQHVLYYTENEFYLGAVDKSSYKCMISFLATSKRACRGAAPV